MHAPSVTDIRLVRLPGPFRPGNWRVEWINVLCEDYGPARDMADELEAMRHWIMIPDRHVLDGQVFGKEVMKERDWDPPFGDSDH